MSLTYEKAGVNLTEGDAWIDVIRKLLGNRQDPRIVSGIGGFSGVFRITQELCLAACCDGVGTKLEVAKKVGLYRGLGQDLVAMNVNDLVTCGARPLFFLDYAACGRLNISLLSEILKGIIEACDYCRCALLGGETAEMPGVYPPEGFDLAGFAVGLVPVDRLIDTSRIQEGDLLVGLPSSGLHSNGYSLVRKALLENETLDLQKTDPDLGEPLAEALMRPTRLYVPQALAAVESGLVKGMAHITGGGLEGNLNRLLPKSSQLKIEIDYTSWKRPPIFEKLSKAGVQEEEMRRVFNLGIGYVFVVSKEDEAAFCELLERLHEKPLIIGKIGKRNVDVFQ